MHEVAVDVHLGPQTLAETLRDDVWQGLSSTPKTLPPKWFYDERGSRLFDEITKLEEYYPTRREREILRSRAEEIATITRCDTLVELGSGTSEKTRILLRACRPARFVGFDVSEETLRDAARELDAEFPSMRVHAVVGDFERHLAELPADGCRLIAFLGGTIGNLLPGERERFLKDLQATMHPGDHALIGFDLVKDVGRLEAAYDDARGVTASFNKNVLRVLNRELGADFDPDAFEHRALFDTEEEWIEMRLRSVRAQTVHITALDLDVAFERDEELRTEVSAKFRPDGIVDELTGAGLMVRSTWTDACGDFALALATV